MRIGSHPDARTARAKALWREACGIIATVQHARAIAALPSKIWRGPKGDKPPVRVYKLTCEADFGQGPHDVWVPAAAVWSLLSTMRYRCPYHQ